MIEQDSLNLLFAQSESPGFVPEASRLNDEWLHMPRHIFLPAQSLMFIVTSRQTTRGNI